MVVLPVGSPTTRLRGATGTSSRSDDLAFRARLCMAQFFSSDVGSLALPGMTNCTSWQEAGSEDVVLVPLLCPLQALHVFAIPDGVRSRVHAMSHLVATQAGGDDVVGVILASVAQGLQMLGGALQFGRSVERQAQFRWALQPHADFAVVATAVLAGKGLGTKGFADVGVQHISRHKRTP